MDETCFSCGKKAEVWFEGYPLCNKCYEQAQKKGFKELAKVVEEKPVAEPQVKGEPMEPVELNPEDNAFIIGVLAVILVVIIFLILAMM